MRINQIITDYISDTVLTTLGDLLVRGVGDPQRLAAVAIGQVLKSQGVGALPAWGVPSILENNVATGHETINSATTTSVTGLGFQPGLIIILCRDTVTGNANFSIGIDLVSEKFLIGLEDDAADCAGNQVYSIHLQRDVANYMQGDVDSVNADGFDILTTLTGAISLELYWAAIG